MSGYYDDKLAAERLRRCYELAPPRVVRYLEAEVQHVLSRLEPGAAVAGGGICRMTLFGFPRVKRVNKGSDSYAKGNPFRDSGR